MIRKINRIFQNFMREKRLKIGKYIWDRKEKKNYIKGDNFILDNNIKSILFLRHDGKIGDMVVNTLMFREIKKYYPFIKIGVVTKGGAVDIIKNNPYVDKIYYYEKNRKKIKELAIKLRNDKYDLLIDFSEMLRVNQMMLINLALARFNMGIEKENWRLFDISLDIRNFNKHISKMYVKILNFLGISDLNIEYDLYPSNYILKNINLKENDFIIFNPFAASKHRSFSEENIIKFLNILEKKYTEKIVIIGENEKLTSLKKIKENDKILIFKTQKIMELLELIKYSKFVITPDTAIVHIATAFNKKSICFYRKEKGKEDNNSIFWSPNSSNAHIIFVEQEVKNGEEVDINKLNFNLFISELERI